MQEWPNGLVLYKNLSLLLALWLVGLPDNAASPWTKFSHPEVAGRTFLQNVSTNQAHYTVQNPDDDAKNIYIDSALCIGNLYKYDRKYWKGCRVWEQTIT